MRYKAAVGKHVNKSLVLPLRHARDYLKFRLGPLWFVKLSEEEIGIFIM